MKRLKTGGRTLGVKNKDTAQIKAYLELLLSNKVLQLEQDIDSLEPLQRVKYTIELAKMILNKESNNTKELEHFYTVEVIDNNKD